MKQKVAVELGMDFTLKQFPEDIHRAQLLAEIERFNADPKVHGILVQLPLPAHLDERSITQAVSIQKDVDGFHVSNVGKLALRGETPLFVPCTPQACMELLKRSGVQIAGKHAVVIGRSNIVGHPVAELLLKANATVTVCHSQTQNIADVVRTGDIVVAAIGQPAFVRGDWLKPGAVVIDVGINTSPHPEKPGAMVLKGDVNFEEALPVVSAITPVPGGVGPMTIAMLMQNTVASAQRSVSSSLPAMHLLPLDIQDPVPSDIAISRAQTPKHMRVVCEELGIHESEFDLYGKYKAKVSLSILDRLANRENGNYVVVAGITPTPLGEGKSTTTLGLAQALGAELGRMCFANIRQPSQGPTFGIKGGAAGGGYAQVIPMEDFNLHLTGDIHAVTAANNLLGACPGARRRGTCGPRADCWECLPFLLLSHRSRGSSHF
ncbi:formate-tetrahydrofolate ligase [Fonticula alba]|uniref:Formate-tetrahydrofolate ligase n=1 Tax=Fonticula alba TaxID=691883 RepID=A0A058Z636_FONAL|nr:formate-tetrahydrofolate ligase [Fonticula alba]KCV68957.1 formate-tetrahydrofolate ligase [Fonticula alba]|eukprot:XP_009496528.1 formate-tetrahydrofolate ligase [Fonticula alba]